MALTLLKAVVRISNIDAWIVATTVTTIESVTLLGDNDTVLIIYT